MRISFETIEYNFEIISRLSRNAYIFAQVWSNYLKSCGWTEMEWEIELEKSMYQKIN